MAGPTGSSQGSWALPHALYSDQLLVERFFGELTSEAVREGSFQSVRELYAPLNLFWRSAIKNPKKYVWRANGLKILEKIQRAKQALAGVAVNST